MLHPRSAEAPAVRSLFENLARSEVSVVRSAGVASIGAFVQLDSTYPSFDYSLDLVVPLRRGWCGLHGCGTRGDTLDGDRSSTSSGLRKDLREDFGAQTLTTPPS